MPISVLRLHLQILEDVLVLRLENGLDTCIPVSASYLRSCYGMSLEALVHTHGPVRQTDLPAYVPREEVEKDGGVAAEHAALLRVQQAAAPGMPPPPPPLKLPKELWRLVDTLWSGSAMQEKDLFASHGVPEELHAIREALDCGVAFTTPCSPHSYAQALQELVRSLPLPLLPYECYPVGVGTVKLSLVVSCCVLHHASCWGTDFTRLLMHSELPIAG